LIVLFIVQLNFAALNSCCYNEGHEFLQKGVQHVRVTKKVTVP